MRKKYERIVRPITTMPEIHEVNCWRNDTLHGYAINVRKDYAVMIADVERASAKEQRQHMLNHIGFLVDNAPKAESKIIKMTPEGEEL